MRLMLAELLAHRAKPGWRSQRRTTAAERRLASVTQLDAGASARDIAAAMGVNRDSVYRWRRKQADMIDNQCPECGRWLLAGARHWGCNEWDDADE